MKRQNSRSSGKRKLDRAVTKKCHTCSQECAVARKTCQCGYQFPTRTRVQPKNEPETPTKTEEDEDLMESKRRRFRTKRMRPDFFNPLDMEYSSRRKATEVKKKRGRPKGSISKPKPEPEQKPSTPPEEENMFANLPSEKMLQFNIILQELNHKFVRQNFKPPE